MKAPQSRGRALLLKRNKDRALQRYLGRITWYSLAPKEVLSFSADAVEHFNKWAGEPVIGFEQGEIG